MENKTYLTSLTPLRGLAALFVMVFHCDLFLGFGILVNPDHSHLIQKGYLMVDFFFVLSGFIMCYVYASSFQEKINGNSFRNFVIARFARVYPLHLFTFLWILLFHFSLVVTGNYQPIWVDNLANNYSAIPAQFLLLHAMHLFNWTTWNGPSWSISVEWWMYMLFPFIVYWLMKQRRNVQIALFFLLWAGMWFIVLYIKPNNPLPIPFPVPVEYTMDVTADFGFLRCFLTFTLGMLTYQIYHQRTLFSLLSKSYSFLALIAIMVGCMHFAVYDTFTVLTFPLIILSAVYNSTLVNNVFSKKPLQRLGDLSYSIYLTHFPVFVTLGTVAKYFVDIPPRVSLTVGWMICGVWIIITILVSMATYHFIELPARNWINGWNKRRNNSAVSIQPKLIPIKK